MFSVLSQEIVVLWTYIPGISLEQRDKAKKNPSRLSLEQKGRQELKQNGFIDNSVTAEKFHK